jgi:pyruvyltransferase
MRCYWWAPYRSARDALPEIRERTVTWLKMTAQTKAWRLLYNFGDELNRLVLPPAFQQSIEWVPPSQAQVIGIGSIMELTLRRNANAAYWGTGLRGDVTLSSQDIACLRRNSLAVRGPRTRDMLGLPMDTPVGDPALVLSRIRGAKEWDRDGPVVLIPHFSSWSKTEDVSYLRRALGDPVLAAPNTAAPAMLDLIESASCVVSSSLHGLIVADALGVPSVHLSGKNTNETSFKFQDYYMSTGKSSIQFQPRNIGSHAVQAAIADRDRNGDTYDASIRSLTEGLLEVAEQASSSFHSTRLA